MTKEQKREYDRQWRAKHPNYQKEWYRRTHEYHPKMTAEEKAAKKKAYAREHNEQMRNYRIVCRKHILADKDAVALALKLYNARTDKGLTQKQLGALVGLSAISIGNYENCKCRFNPDIFNGVLWEGEHKK